MTASMVSSDYDNHLRSLLRAAKCLNNAGPEQCLTNKNYTFELSDKT